MNLREAFIWFILCDIILVRKSVLIEWRWDCHQLTDLIFSLVINLVNISWSLSKSGIFIANKEEGVS